MKTTIIMNDFNAWKECVGLDNADFDTMTALYDVLNGEHDSGNPFSVREDQGREYLCYDNHTELFELTAEDREDLIVSLSYVDGMTRHMAEQFYKQIGKD